MKEKLELELKDFVVLKIQAIKEQDYVQASAIRDRVAMIFQESENLNLMEEK